jgi:hypothetical protein
LNTDCFNSSVALASGLTSPPYVNYGDLDTYGVKAVDSYNNTIYDNLFNSSWPACDNNNGTLDFYELTFSLFNYNGVNYTGSIGNYNYSLIIYINDDGDGDGEFFQGDLLVGYGHINGGSNISVALINNSDGSGLNYATLFLEDDLGWSDCNDVESNMGLDSGDCNYYADDIFVSNGAGNNYTYNADPQVSVADGFTSPPSFNFTSIAFPTNYWNTTLTGGTNIVGGSNIGGNYYGDYTGIDGGSDDIGDTPYSINDSDNSVVNYDYLPLVLP